jgi:flagellin
MDNLQKIRELWVKASNGTNGMDELNAIQMDMNSYVSAIYDMRNGSLMVSSSNGLGSEVFRGTSAANCYVQDFQVGAGDNEFITLDFSDNFNLDNCIDTAAGTITPGTLGEGSSNSLWNQQVGGTVKSIGGASSKLGGINHLDIMIKNLTRMMSVTDKYHARFTAAYDKLQEDKLSYSAYQSQVQDTDYAKTSSDYAKDQIRQNTAASVLTQANAQVGFSLNLLP